MKDFSFPKKELRIFIGYAFLYVGFAFGTGLLIRDYPLPILGAWKFTNQFWYAVLFKIIGLLVVPLLILRRLGYSFRQVTVYDWKPSVQSFTWLVVAFAAGLFLNVWHLAKIPFAQFSAGEIALRSAAAVLFPLLAAALPEEIFYRGVLQTRIESVYGRWAALITTAFLFAAWHLPSRWLLATGIEGQAGDFGSILLGTGLPVFGLGLVFGLLWDRYRSLLPIIAFHWAIDIAPNFSSFFGVRF